MNKHKLTELQFLDQKIKLEKEKVYSHGVILLPGITTLTLGALSDNSVCLAIGTAITLGSFAKQTVNTKTLKKIIKK